MAMRLEEVHPATVHYPLALLPVAIGADLLGRVTGSGRLRRVGRVLMPAAAVGAVAAAVTGLVAQEEVVAEGDARDVLVTHRNLNLSLVTLSTALAAWRVRRETPGVGYLALALAGLGAMTYSAYLGGKMVYGYGVGVTPADGVRDADAPDLRPGRAGEIARRVGTDLERGIARALDDLRRGDVLPAVRRPAAAFPARTASPDGAGRLGTAASFDAGPGAADAWA